MEDSWNNWISSLEKLGEDNSNDQSHMTHLIKDKLLKPSNFSFQSVHHHHHSSTTTSHNNDNNDNNVFPITSTNMGSSSSLCYDYEDASFDVERHGNMLMSNSSNSISIISQDVANSQHIPPSSPSTFILSFENSTLEPALQYHKSNNSPENYKHFETTCSSLILSSEVTLSNDHDAITKPTKAKQGAKKKHRTSYETRDHIMAERKRRQELSERLIALSATIPGLKKTDKAYILREAITYMKQLQERVKELENENKRKRAHSRIFIKKSQVCSREEATSLCETNSHVYSTPPPLPQVEARVLEKEVLIGIHCQKQKDIVLKIMALLQNLHLSLASSSVLPFGTSTLKVTIIAQMGDQYCMRVNDLVKSLRQDLLKTRDIQESYS